MKKIAITDYEARLPLTLRKLPARVSLDASESKLEKKLEKTRKKLGELQDVMYAHGKYAVWICLQGMDTAGKDSLIREVFKDFNARGVVVHSFKTPTDLERKHNYLWRHYIALPARGKFGVFNRTHYENVLVTRVHPEYILKENLPGINSTNDIDDTFWETRFKQINAFEKTIAQNGTIIFKFFLNISKNEQRERLLRRLDETGKNWKFSPGDLKERELWDKYMAYYEDAINRTHQPYAPWYVIPADDKAAARLMVATILHKTLKKYDDIREPEPEPEIMEKLSEYIEQLKQD